MDFMQFSITRLSIVLLSFSSTLCCADWFAYVPDLENNTIVPINLMTNTPASPIPNHVSTSGPAGIAITPNGLAAYVTNQDTQNVTQIDLTTNTASALINVGLFPTSVAITPDGQTAYITNSFGESVTPIAISSNTPGADIDLGTNNNPEGIAITPDGSTAYITIADGSGTLANTVVRLSIATNTLIGTPIPVISPQNIAITPNGKKAYVANGSNNTVTPIDLTMNMALTPIHVGSFPVYVAITADGTTVFVTNNGSNTVTPIDVGTDIPGAPINLLNPPFGSEPLGIAITPDSQTAYVSDSQSGDVTPISTENRTTKTPIPLPMGAAPFGIAITPDQAPTASFINDLAIAGLPSFFDASASTSPVGTIAFYAWDFGDGSTVVVSTPTINHVYQTPGNFLVTLTVTNSGGTSTMQIFTGQTVSNNGGPTAIFSQVVTINPAEPLPPSNFIGTITKNKFLNKTECVLSATWKASPSINVSLYRIYQNGIVVAEILATSPLAVETCLSNCSGRSFEIAAVSSNNLESSHLSLQIVR
jgi:YVTN family beta-propeller protein